MCGNTKYITYIVWANSTFKRFESRQKCVRLLLQIVSYWFKGTYLKISILRNGPVITALNVEAVSYVLHTLSKCHEIVKSELCAVFIYD